ncbi:hypothetical protein HGG64_01525 [Mycoplasma phocoeninasale]|uniref:Lipoprotein n=1 Tax=Mycoplasma phocoeninasale TaxID=2726117 RepID=A0A858U6H8_9MOLU|nr:hypothetical protein [Mycoplasma phocoeninasale]QJG66388.1 hypothetical protein HGG64_01525 [Mycoplasma phocoeninasale]
MKKKNLKWLISLPIVLTAIPLVAAACNKKTIEKEALYLNLYYSAFRGINKDNYKNYSYDGISRNIIETLKKEDPQNADALNKGIELLDDLRSGDAAKQFRVFEELANFYTSNRKEFNRYSSFLKLLDDKNNKFVGGEVTEKDLKSFIKYWGFVEKSGVKSVNYKYLFYPKEVLDEFARNYPTHKEIGKIRKISLTMKFFIDFKKDLGKNFIKEITNTIKTLELN